VRIGMSHPEHISRRKFLQSSAIGLGSVVFVKDIKKKTISLDFPDHETLGRNTVYLPNTLPIRSKPRVDANVVRALQEDEVVVWLREVVGEAPAGRMNRRWVETPEGYIYASSIQPVRNQPNIPIQELPYEENVRGMWVEVTVPHVTMQLANPPARAPWLNDVPQNLWKLYYKQILWVDDLRFDANNNLQYRVNERYGSYGDIFWADAKAFRPISKEEIQPINPNSENKRIVVNINTQSLSCYEGNQEVYFCQVSTGRKLDEYGNPADKWATPVGEFWIWRKLMALHMSGGGTGAGWDTMGIGWTSLFVGEGVAIHSTFWHNDFGTPRSHGCVNVLPDDAKWIFRWTAPKVNYEPGDITDNAYNGTKIIVTEQLY